MKHILLGIFVFFTLSLLSLLHPSGVLAQIAPWPASCMVGDVATLACIPYVFQNVVTAALLFAGVVAVFFIVYAGIRYITSRGDPKAVEGAKNTLTWAIIGLIVILLSFFIINFIGFFTRASCILEFGFGTCPVP